LRIPASHAARRPAWPRRARAPAAFTAAAGAALLAVACGSSPGSQVAELGTTTTPPSSPSGSPGVGGAGSAGYQSPASQMLTFSRCMRSHGEPAFPDPDAQGQIKPQLRAPGIAENTSRYRAAASACRRLLPPGVTNGTSQVEVQQEWREFRSFARCMRRHGVANWPDPQPRSETDPRPIFGIQPVDPQSPINPDSPQIRSKLPACDALLKTANPNRL
jgi:hypothetical protein